MNGSSSRRTILVTNDDGYDAPGIAALVEAVEPLGEPFVVAPETEQSATSHSLTLRRPLRAIRVREGRYRVDGTPTDCVQLAVHSLTGGRVPALLVSGINRGLNVGDDVTYSGTVAGALEGTLLRIPAIAFSCEIDERGAVDYRAAGGLVRRIAREVLERGLPRGVLLNVNFPSGAPRGVRITRQGTRAYRATALERIDPSGQPYYWISGAYADTEDGPDSDHQAILDRCVSITPLHANLTHEPSLAELGRWELSPA